MFAVFERAKRQGKSTKRKGAGEGQKGSQKASSVLKPDRAGRGAKKKKAKRRFVSAFGG